MQLKPLQSANNNIERVVKIRKRNEKKTCFVFYCTFRFKKIQIEKCIANIMEITRFEAERFPKNIYQHIHVRRESCTNF